MENEKLDILVEVLEVFMNQILYIRQVYPSQIFKKRRVYNTPVFVSIYPTLNNYLQNILRTSRELLRNGDLIAEVLLYGNANEAVVERYNFELAFGVTDLNVDLTLDEDAQLLEFEERLRTSLHRMAARLKVLKPLPHDTKFKVLLHTNQAAFLRLTNNSHYQEFPWLYEAVNSEPVKKEDIPLLPLAVVDHVGLRLNVTVSNI